MKRTLRWTGLLAALSVAALAWAEQMVTEVIPLKYRTLDEMVPMLRPLAMISRVSPLSHFIRSLRRAFVEGNKRP